MLLYRLERNNYGVFCESDSKVDMRYSEDALYPSNRFQCGYEYLWHKDYRSACTSIDKLIEYFGSDFADSLNKGCHIVEYNIHKAHVRFGINPDIDIEVTFYEPKIKNRTVILKGKDGGWQE